MKKLGAWEMLLMMIVIALVIGVSLQAADYLFQWQRTYGMAIYGVVLLPVIGYILPFLFSKAISDGINLSRYEQARRMTNLIQHKS